MRWPGPGADAGEACAAPLGSQLEGRGTAGTRLVPVDFEPGSTVGDCRRSRREMALNPIPMNAVLGRAVRAAIVLAATISFGFGCASAPTAEPEPRLGPHGLIERTFELPDPTALAPERSFREVNEAVTAFQPLIGRYPPQIESEQDREVIYEAWSGILLSAQAWPEGEGRDEEARLYLLAELYRQGHNLDVLGAAELADESLMRCLDLFPTSRACNLSASYFYLSVIHTSDVAKKAEKSLATLRSEAIPGYDEEAEAGYVFLHLYQRDTERAREQMERFIELFPESARAEDFRRMLPHVGKDLETREWTVETE